MDRPARAPALRPRRSGMVPDTAARAQSIHGGGGEAAEREAVPVALVLWARVSAEIDARLSAAPRHPIRLHPNEWQSGDVIWIIDAVGEPKAVQQCVDALAKMAFQGKQVRSLRSL